MADSLGTIGIDLSLNSAAFKKGVNSIQEQTAQASGKISSCFKKIATAALAAFSAKKIADFGAECVNLAQAQTEAETKLQTIMRQRMGATEESINSVKEFTSSQQQLGVVGDEVQMAGAQQLSTFLNNESALEKLIPAMNDLAVQQNGVNVTSESMTNIGNLMGKVMQGQTSALTRVGITFSEAEEKILKYGNEEERAATLSQVITNNVGKMNSAIAATPAGKMQQVKNSLGGIMGDIGTTLTSWWTQEGGGREIFANVCDMFTNIGTTFMNIYNDWIMPAWNFIVGLVQSAWDNCLKPIFEQGISFIGKVCDCIATLWNNWLSPIVNWLVDFFGPIFTNVFNAVKGVFDTVFKFIGDIISSIMRTFGGLIDFFTGVFSGDWKKAWNGIKDFFGGIWDGIWGTVKFIVNLIIDGINNLWTGIYNFAKAIVDGIGGIAGAIGSIFGQDWSFKLPDNPPLIPKLASGGLVTAPTLALVGDNRGASAGNPEVVAPLNKLQSMLNVGGESAESGQIVTLLSRIYELLLMFIDGGGNVYEFVAELNGDPIFKETIRQNNIYKKRHGGRSAFEGV